MFVRTTLQLARLIAFVLFTCASICLLGVSHVRAQIGPGGPAAGPAQAKSKPPATQEIVTADIVRANLETSYLAHPFGIAGIPSIIFECNLTPHFFVRQQSWPFAIVLTPKVVLRMFNEESTPVRSPSFMPRISAYFWFQQTVSRTPAFYGSVTLSHHSNGQAGPFFGEDGQINHEDGSFSTNFFEFTAYATGFAKGFLGWSSLGLQWHPGFNEDPELRDRYGLLRINLASTLVADLPFHGQVNLRISAILDEFQTSSENEFVQELERFPVSIAYAMTVPGIDLGVYASYYVGHDYYNLYFDRLIHVIQLGISGGYSHTLLKSEESD